MCCCYSVWKCIILVFLFCISVVRPYGRALCFLFLCSYFVYPYAPLALSSFLHVSLFVHFSLFVLFYFYETILSSSPVLVLIHFILLYMLHYYYYIRDIIMYTCICIPVLVVMSSIVYLNHIISSTLFFCFLQSSYRPAQSRNMDVFVILIMSFNVFVSTIITPTLWLVLVRT